MKLVVLGATGATGQLLLEQALSRGHHVTAVVRTPSKLDGLKDQAQLTVVQGDVFSADDLAGHFAGADAVLSTLGFSAMNRSTTDYSTATAAMLAAVRRTDGLNRLILMHSWYTAEDSRQHCPLVLRYTLIPLIRPVLDDMRRVEQMLEKEEDDGVEWTVVLPPGLKTAPHTDGEIKSEEDVFFLTNLSAMSISRGDVARYMLDTLEQEKHKKKIVAIGMK